MTPPVPDMFEEFPESFYIRLFSFLYMSAILFVALSQIVFFFGFIIFLYRMYVSKVITMTHSKKWCLTIFAVLYIVSFLALLLGLLGVFSSRSGHWFN